ncbi:MAG: MurR/RpiR family transcriptional regulator [Myxococcota bacterium]
MLLAKIAAHRDRCPPAERRVAEVVLARPDWASTASITELAGAAAVSEPTVVRFCRGLGFGGVRPFKVALVRESASGLAYVHPALAAGHLDSATKVVADGLFGALLRLRPTLDLHALDAAADTLASARRVVAVGFGTSGLVAADAQQRLTRIGMLAVASSDPHLLAATAATLGAADVVLAISHSGESAELLETCAVARARGASVVAITSPGTTLATAADRVVAVAIDEDAAVQLPMVSRLAHLLVLDILFVGVAARLGPDAVRALAGAKAALAARKRSG